MTAPTIPAPAASEAAPVVPVVPVIPAAPTPSAPQGVKRAADILAGSNEDLLTRFGLGDPALAESPETEAAPAEAAAAEPTAEPSADTPAGDAVAPTPDTPAPPRQLATQFKVFDTTGGELDVPDVQISFTANGKERKEPLDKVVRLAQTGYYNEEREQQVVQQRAQATQFESENKQLKSYVEDLRRDVQALFADATDATYNNLKQQYARANSPEARADRAERALADERQRTTNTSATNQAQAFTSVLNQHLTQLTEQHPEVPFHEILGRFNELTLPYMQAGRVPPESFPVIAQLVDQELTPWVRHHHETRTETKAQRERDAQAKIDRERAAATSQVILAKRAVARAVPGKAGTTPTAIREIPQAPKYQKATDILSDVGRLVQATPG